MKKIFLSLAMALLVASCGPKDQPLDRTVQLQNADGIPIAKVKINGKEVYVIMDTGASISVLDATQSKAIGFTTYPDPESGQVSGYGGNTVMLRTNVDRMILDGEVLSGDFKAQDISNVVRAIQNGTGFYISGIVGMNFMRQHDFKIDFIDNTITFNP
jgi:predicted aspartyl protease